LLQTDRQPVAKEVERNRAQIEQTQEEIKQLEQLLANNTGTRIGTAAQETRNIQEIRRGSLQVELNNRMKVLDPLQRRLAALDDQIADIKSREYLTRLFAERSTAPSQDPDKPWYERYWKWLLGGLVALYLLSKCFRTSA
jgi:hypothetical protein